MKRTNILNCPKEATHVHMNPTNEFIQLFYRIKDNNINYLSTCGGGWCYSDSAEKDKEFINKLTPIED
jgi:hypothetical protein